MAWAFRIENRSDAVGGFVGKTRRPDQGRFDEASEMVEALKDMGAVAWPLVEAEQVHGSKVAIVTSETLRAAAAADRPLRLAGIDGLLTDQRGVALAIYVADCLAVYLQHRARPAVGLAHAGWRGLAVGLAGKLARKALDAYGGSPQDLDLILSPCIGPCCFEVGEEVAAAFEEVPGAVGRSRELPHVDLRRVARAQLEAAGVPRGQVQMWPECTRCDPDRFASYRAEGEDCGTNVALIGLSE